MAKENHHLMGQPFARHRRSKLITDSDIENAIRYLRNPTSSGLWKLEAEWHTNAGIIKYIIGSAKQKAKKEFSSSSEVFLKSRLDRLERSLEDIDNITFLLGTILALKEDSEEEKYQNYLARLLNINYPFIKKKYAPAIKFFNEYIYFPDFGGRLGSYVAGVKAGNVLIEYGPRDAYRENIGNTIPDKVKLEIVAFKSKPLLDIYEFLSLLGVVANKNLYTIFSPEDELLSPYTKTLESLLPSLGLPKGIVRHYDKMLTDYDNETYTACVTTAGLVTEEYLIQLYETLSRRKCPPNQMLGRTYSSIGKIVKGLLSPSRSPTQQSGKNVLKTLKSKKYTTLEAGILSSTSNLIRYIDNKLQTLGEELTSSKHDVDYSIFPETVKMGTENVIYYRNAASHKSTFPIDALEAQKSVLGSLSLVLWWEAHRKKINGSLSQKDIIEQLVESAKSYDLVN